MVVFSDNNGVDASFILGGCNCGSEAMEAASSDVVCRLAFTNIFRRSWFGEGSVWTLGLGASVNNRSPKLEYKCYQYCDFFLMRRKALLEMMYLELFLNEMPFGLAVFCCNGFLLTKLEDNLRHGMRRA